MRRLTMWLVTLMLMVGLAGCATLAPEPETKVVCPACGYDFDMPRHHN